MAPAEQRNVAGYVTLLPTRFLKEADLAAAEWNKVVPPAGKIDDFGDGGGI
jgi:hypothetical protein